MILYHYTTAFGIDGISTTGVIRQSQDQIRDAMLGAGVYFTSMDPYRYSKEQIAQNNYCKYINQFSTASIISNLIM